MSTLKVDQIRSADRSISDSANITLADDGTLSTGNIKLANDGTIGSIYADKSNCADPPLAVPFATVVDVLK